MRTKWYIAASLLSFAVAVGIAVWAFYRLMFVAMNLHPRPGENSQLMKGVFLGLFASVASAITGVVLIVLGARRKRSGK